MDDSTRHDVEYMLKRSIGLCLTDGKEPIPKGVSVRFDLAEGKSATSHPHLVTVLFICHFIGACNSFEREVLAPLDRWNAIARADQSRGTGRIDWSATAAARGASGRKAVVLKATPRQSQADLAVAALVIEEYLRLAEACIEESHTLATDANPVLRSVVSQAQERLEQLRKRAANLADFLPFEDARESIQDWLNKRSVTCKGATRFDMDWPQDLFAKALRTAKQARVFLDWRRNISSTRAGFGPGRWLSLSQSRDPTGLFELWCFVELIEASRHRNRPDFVQRSLLRRREGPLFSDSSGREVYYDFHGLPQAGPLGHGLLQRAHVEWLIKHPTLLAESVVIDTKYKQPSAKDYLTTLGYMANFGVNRGAVMFRGDLDPEVGPADLAAHNFVGLRRGPQRLCLLSLIPTQAAHADNASALKMFHDFALAD